MFNSHGFFRYLFCSVLRVFFFTFSQENWWCRFGCACLPRLGRGAAVQASRNCILDLMNTGQQLSLHTTLRCKSYKFGSLSKCYCWSMLNQYQFLIFFLPPLEVDSSLFHSWYNSSARRFIAWSCAWSSWSDVRPSSLVNSDQMKRQTYACTTVDGQNPAPVDIIHIPLFTGFHTSQVVQDFLHQQ